jgi:ribonuclease Z
MSTLVQAGGKNLLFDAGRGVTMRLHQAKLPLADISAIFLTHLHSDHIAGLPDLYATAPLTPGGSRRIPLEVWGPKGTQGVAQGIQEMFAENARVRLLEKEITPAVMRISVHEIPANGGAVYEAGGVKVTAFLVDHGNVKPAYGYRIDYANRAVVLSGDTTYAPTLVQQAKGADLLIQCVAIGSRKLESAAPDFVRRFYRYLANPETAGRILSEAQPRLAVFSHISLYSRPGIPRATSEELLSRLKAVYNGPFMIGEDLASFNVSDNGVAPGPYSPEQRQTEPN